MGATRWVIWAAVSSEEQAERYSLTEQLELSRQHCAKWGGEVVAELTVGESRSIVLLEDAAARIPAYAELRRLIADKSFDVLVVYDLTRLGRKRSLIAAVEELCADAGITIYELDNPPTTLDASTGYDRQLLSAIKGATSQNEVERLRKRMRFGREGRARRGDIAHQPPYGYVWQFGEGGTRALVVDDVAAVVVRDIIARYLAGAGQQTIAAELTERGVPTPTGGSTWHKNSVNVILWRIWTYAGYAELYRGSQPHNADPARYIRAAGTHPALVDEATALAVQAERDARRANRHIADTPSRLTGLVWCEACNKPMAQARNDDGTRRNADGTRRRALFYCQPPHAGGSVSTALVLEAIAAALDDLAHADLSAVTDDDNTAAHLTRIAQHEAAIERHSAALRRADDAYVAGIMDADRYRAQVDRLTGAIAAERSAVEQTRAAIAADKQRGTRQERLAELAASGPAMLTTPDAAAANAWLRRLVRVWVRDNTPVAVDLAW
jgi:DNA invertase Pin-like site-specific DNA recombinase